MWDGALSWWSSQICSRQSSGGSLRTSSSIRRKNIAVESRNSQFSLFGRVLRATTTDV
jgi:hypothetical protein